jgi:RNA polymerase sigma-70 factor (ECF subfamily)
MDNYTSEERFVTRVNMDETTRQAMRLWTSAQPTVSAFVTSLVRDFRDRDDVLQETAVAVIESFNRYDTARPFIGWALGIARNQVGLYLRRRGRDRHTFDTETVEQLAVAFENVTSEELHQLDHLHACMQRLEGRARQLCEMRYRDDLKPAAIAAAVGMSANSVAKALQRIRDQLRTCIETSAAAAF